MSASWRWRRCPACHNVARASDYRGHYSVQFDHGGPPLILAPRHLQRVAWRRRP
jgi:hypothetical protein